jgi:hypothetical protein
MRWVMRRIESTALVLEPCTARICPTIASVALAVCTASDLTSEATTANPRPASPARAASIVALSASRLVCSAMVWMSLTIADLLRRFRKRCHFAVGRVRFLDRKPHHIVGLRDLAGDFGDRTGQFVGGVGRDFDAAGGVVGGRDRAGGRLRAVIGSGRKRRRRRLHRGRAVAERPEQPLHAGAERGDRGVDRAAALLLFGHVVALLLQLLLFGDVLVRRYPAAVRHRRVDGMNGAAIARAHDPLGDVAGGDAVHDLFAVLLGIR